LVDRREDVAVAVLMGWYGWDDKAVERKAAERKRDRQKEKEKRQRRMEKATAAGTVTLVTNAVRLDSHDSSHV
jgi:hypothetical protein